MDDQGGHHDAHVLRLQLELDLDREPISGRLRTKRGGDERFVGWIGFIDALKRLQERGDASAGPSGDPPDPPDS
jgi:hypothetical protein